MRVSRVRETQESFILGATFLAALLEGDVRQLALFRENYDAEELLASLIPQVLAVAKRFCDDRGISMDELGDRMVGAAMLRSSWGIDQRYL